MTLGPFHISTMNLILWGCVIWLPAFMAVILRNETKFKKPKKFSGGIFLRNNHDVFNLAFDILPLGWLIYKFFPLLSTYKSLSKVMLNTS